MKALIPAAGLGTRWYPWSKVVPKELVPLGRYPAIHYVLEEAVAAGIREIGIIISKTKQLIRTYVEDVWMVNHQEIQIMWFYQPSPRGVGDALLCAKEWVQDEPTAVLYPDEIHPSEGGMIQLRRVYEDSPGCWIGLTANKQDRRQAVLEVEKIGENKFCVVGFGNIERIQRIGYGTGRYIFGPGFDYFVDSLSQTESLKADELDDDALFAPLWDKGVRGTVLDEPIFDIGTPENLCSALSSLCQPGKIRAELEKVEVTS